jgi:putative flippase GtrA
VLPFSARIVYGGAMEAILVRVLPAKQAALLLQFVRFGVVGGIGFVVTTAVVYATRPWIGNYLAVIPAFLLAATGNWVLNRLWTFRGHGTKRQSLLREWTMFLAANAIGFALNAGVYWILIAVSPLCASNPVIALVAGTLAGMFANFFLSRRVVFR